VRVIGMNTQACYVYNFSLLNSHLEPNDISPALERLTKRLSKRL
jgi:hypothetical protein